MRAVKAKSIRRKAAASPTLASSRRSSSMMKSIGLIGGLGKSRVAMEYARELARPKGTWKEYWTLVIRNISAGNRLPRGFREPTSIFRDLDSKGHVAMSFRR